MSVISLTPLIRYCVQVSPPLQFSQNNMWTLKPEVTINYDEGNPSSGSLLFTNETHTMGNVIRQTLLKNPSVSFCGYTVPHPAENKMALRIQADDDSQVIDLVNEGLDNVKNWSLNTKNAFEEAWSKSTFA